MGLPQRAIRNGMAACGATLDRDTEESLKSTEVVQWYTSVIPAWQEVEVGGAPLSEAEASKQKCKTLSEKSD
jgi:hypothetical protein